MSDLIDRNSLLRSLEKFAPEKHDALVEMLIKKEPTVDAIPVAFIESEKQRVQGMIEESVKMGMIAESERLSLVMVILDHVVSNWYYNTGPEWRGEPNDTNRF